MRIHPGFSLIELLVVIAIVAVLAALLLPAIGLVRDQSRTIGCTSNMRQAGVGFLVYAEENNGILPWGEGAPSGCPYSWVSALATLAETDKIRLTCAGAQVTGGTLHYTGNLQTLTARTFGNFRWSLKPVALPELNLNAPLIFDAGLGQSGGINAFLSSMNMGLTFYYLGNTGLSPGIRDADPQPAGSSGNFMVQNRHNGKRRANYLFGDGRVQCLAPADLTCGDFRIRSNGRRYF